MGKKRKKSKRTGWLINPQQINKWLDKASVQIFEGDYKGALHTCQRVLRYVPAKSEKRAETLEQMGMAHSMLKNFTEAYDALSEALTLKPEDPILWYNRGLAGRFTMRIGQSLRDTERAVELLDDDHQMSEKFTDALNFSRELAQSSLDLRRPGFTLDQLIEQEELFQLGLKYMANQEWVAAGAVFRHVIYMDDCLPQPWGNLGGSLVMQQRYDEAETAWKRALEIEPNYEFARRNLELLPQIRSNSDLLQSFKTINPFEGQDLKQSITFIKE